MRIIQKSNHLHGPGVWTRRNLTFSIGRHLPRPGHAYPALLQRCSLPLIPSATGPPIPSIASTIFIVLDSFCDRVTHIQHCFNDVHCPRYLPRLGHAYPASISSATGSRISSIASTIYISLDTFRDRVTRIQHCFNDLHSSIPSAIGSRVFSIAADRLRSKRVQLVYILKL
jgi:hypothetical protein